MAEHEKMVVCRDLDGREHRVPASHVSWRPSVYGIIVRNDELLVCRHFGKFNLPGGGIEIGETLEDGLLREIKEETGIVAARARLVAADSNLFKMPYERGFVQSVLLYYVCEAVGGELSIDGFDAHERQYAELAQWVPLSTMATWQIASSNDWRPFAQMALELNKSQLKPKTH